MEIFDDVVAEQDRLETLLAGLSADDWLSPSAAAGWTVADVVLHLAQTEEAVVATATAEATGFDQGLGTGTVEQVMDHLVEAERSAPEVIFERWRNARFASVDALRKADPQQPLTWVAAALKPRTLATTRLAEHWAHGLDIADPLGLPFPDTARLKHVAWLGHSTLPYAFAMTSEQNGEQAGEPAPEIFCELIGPDGDLWRYGPETAESTIRGTAGEFCRVGARRLAPQDSSLVTTGPQGETALRLLRNFAV